MSDSRYRPKGRRKASSAWQKFELRKPLRQAFRTFFHKVMRGNLYELEPRERVKPDYWD